MQTVTEADPGNDRRSVVHSVRWAVGILVVVGLLLAAGAITLTDEPSGPDAAAEIELDAPVGPEQIPGSFPSEVHRSELLAVAKMQSDGLLVPTWLPAEGMTIGRSGPAGNGSYDLWFVTSENRYVHVVVRPGGFAEFPLVEVSGFSEADADRVRQSLRVLAP